MNGSKDQQNNVGGCKWERKYMKMIKKFEASSMLGYILDQMENCNCEGT